MLTTYRIYRPGQVGYDPHQAELPQEPSYDELCRLIEPLLDGAHLEHVTVLFRDKRADMFVADEGAGLPVNVEATAIYHAASLSREPGADASAWPKIHGTAILFERRVWF